MKIILLLVALLGVCHAQTAAANNTAGQQTSDASDSGENYLSLSEYTKVPTVRELAFFGLGLLLMCLMCVFVLCVCMPSRSKPVVVEESTEIASPEGSITDVPSEGKLTILPPDCLQDLTIMMYDSRQILVKKGKNDKCLSRERRMLRRVPHPNVVHLSGGPPNCISFSVDVVGYQRYGVLSEVMKRPSFDSSDRIYVLSQLCGAIQHLHQLEVLHRNIRAASCLLTSPTDLLLYNFELACSERTPFVCHGKNPRWMAYEELFAEEPTWTQKSDVWALGITIWEVIQGQRPYDEIEEEEEVREQIQQHRKLELKHWPDTLAAPIDFCWAARPSLRPTAGELASVLRSAGQRMEGLQDGARPNSTISSSGETPGMLGYPHFSVDLDIEDLEECFE